MFLPYKIISKMAHWLNRLFTFSIVLFFSCPFLLSQERNETDEKYKDYKDKQQFEKFYKKRRLVGAWQINQLKNGALVVRLKTKNLLISSLLKSGDVDKAEKVRLENRAVNISIVRAYLKNYNFSKIYFIYSHSGDSLLRGIRQNIFLDSTLNLEPKIKMEEKFYLMAETDIIYNSSIGFVKEDTARFVKEEGSHTDVECPIVIKNKYGHQLKRPFPFSSPVRLVLEKVEYETEILLEGTNVPFNVGGLIRLPGGREVAHKINGKPVELYIPQEYTFKRFSIWVDNLNEDLKYYYRASSHDIDENKDPEIKPFLY